MLRMYLIVQTGVVYTYRPVVDKCHVHHGSKDAVFDLVWLVKLLDFLEEGLVEGLGVYAACGLVEVGLVTLLHGSKECELRNCNDSILRHSRGGAGESVCAGVPYHRGPLLRFPRRPFSTMAVSLCVLRLRLPPLTRAGGSFSLSSQSFAF